MQQSGWEQVPGRMQLESTQLLGMRENLKTIRKRAACSMVAVAKFRGAFQTRAEDSCVAVAKFRGTLQTRAEDSFVAVAKIQGTLQTRVLPEKASSKEAQESEVFRKAPVAALTARLC
mmetsp:Transcript_24740/g.48186  ORF Transcript_24740/g.48186 Transcript_24740/m.48186 type:complete len:118 (+) Transcript_24740:57-410(+)